MSDDSVIAVLSLWLSRSALLPFFVLLAFRLFKSLDGLKVKILIFEWQAHLLKFVCLGFDLYLKWHQSIVEQPILGIKCHVILSLNKCDIGANVELILKLTHQLEEHFLLLDESELGAVEQILVLLLGEGHGLLLLFVGVLELMVFCFREHGLHVVRSLDILAYFHVFVVIGLECHKISLFEAWNDQRKIKVAQWVQEQYLQLRIMFDVQIIKLWIFEFFFFLLLALVLLFQALVVDFPGNVLEKQ